ncbi:MAG TPA: PAS domain S-box protein, partial [Williamwhitmania sp.]|nr:PAS domain S-box protein [Williamwhitmania sp.]
KFGLALLGYNGREIIGRKALDLLILKDNPGSPYFTEMGQRLVGTQETLTTEGICHSRSGEMLTILWVITNTIGAGSLPEMLCTGNNITGLVGAQEALRESQLRLKSIMDHTNDLICQIDSEGRHLYVSPSYKRILGYESQDLIGESFFTFLHPDDLTYTITEFTEVLQTNSPKSVSVRFRSAEGNYVWIESHGNAIINKDGKVTGMVVSSRDITEQNRHHKEIEDSELRYKTLLNAIPDLMFVQTNEGVYLDYHCSDESMLLTSPESFIGKKHADVLPADILSLFEEKFQHVRESNEIEKFEYQAKLNNGQQGIFEARVTTFGPDKMLTIIRDITDRKKSEQLIVENEKLLKKKNKEYIAINEELNLSYTHIQSINQELTVAKEKAEESDRLKSAFLANMSHEIRTPMNGMLGFADLLRRPNLAEEKRRLYIDIINANGNQLLAIINDIIDISKIEAGQVVAEMRPANITKLYLEIQHQFTTLAKARDLEFTAHYPDIGEVVTNTDATKLRQILFNLLNNALKFTPTGRVETGFSAIDGNLLFYVKDTGIGIREELHATVFERFRQVENSISMQQGGTGLGLSISKSLVELLGGTIWLESEPGKGSTFFFTIPYLATEEKLANQNDFQMAKQASWIGKNILIAEDDETNYGFLSTMITEAGMQPIWATNGRDAIKLCEENQNIDLALIDVRMPIMDGYETTRQIKELRSSLPVVVHTAFVSTDGKARAYAAGCDAFLAKPVSRKDLIGLFDRFFS